jgi:hypothetical protein
MRSLLSPFGILLAQTIPAVLLAALYTSVLRVVHPLMDAGTIQLWWRFGWALGLLIVGGAACTVWLLATKRTIPVAYAGLSFAAHAALLYVFSLYQRDLMPWDIPRWMMPEDAELYAFRLLSLPLAHALFVLVLHSLPEGERGKPVRDLFIAAAIPLATYLFVQVIEPFRFNIDFERHAWIVVMITLVVAFLFFLFRSVLAMARIRGKGSLMPGTALRILVALVLPMLGLLLNAGKLSTGGIFTNAFGNLSHPAFFIIAVLNAAVVIWPSSTAPRLRLLQFALRGVGFSYVLYFFLLFLPFLPLSIVAIIAFGMGFLMLAPVLLFMVQGTLLLEDVRFLKDHWPVWKMSSLLLLSMAVIPTVITANYLWQRSILHDALAYVYHPDLSATAAKPLDAGALAQVLDRIDEQQGGRRGRGSGSIPFLSPWYDRIVLDNLTLGQAKTRALRSIFLNETTEQDTSAQFALPESDVVLDSAHVESRFDAEQQAWRSWVHLDMQNLGTTQSEYVTTFSLPDGAWISDQYLMIEGERVAGILAEKKAATWVYQQIVNVRRDPSLTRYIAPGRVQMRVFPFAADETRQGGFEVLHKEAMQLVLDGDTLQLGDAAMPSPKDAVTAPDGRATYVPKAAKRELPLVQRSAHWHVVVDGSEARRTDRAATLARIREMIDAHSLDTARITLHITDAYVTSVPWHTADDTYLQHQGHGGFFSDRAVRRILHAACSRPSPEVPVIVLSRSGPMGLEGSTGVWLDELAELARCLPEGPDYFTLEHDGNVLQRRMSDHSITSTPLASLTGPPHVLAWPSAEVPTAYLPADDGPSIVLNNTDGMMGTSPVKRHDWEHALALEGRWRTHLLHPEHGTAGWRSLVRGSFQAQVLTPLTAWLCLENDAQRNALLKKQEELLKADAALDAGDDEITRMSEPGLLSLLLPILFLAVWRMRSRHPRDHQVI